MNKKPCIKMVRYTLLFFILISSIIFLVVLGFDLDLLLNGPKYLSKVIAVIFNRNQEGVINEKELSADLMESMHSLWIHIPMVLIMTMSIIALLLNALGCTGACVLSYSLLSGFFIFTLVVFVFCLSLTLWIFLSKNDHPAIASYVTEKISEYNKTGGIFNLVIDTVQRDLQCCGFLSPSEWSDIFPASCCQDKCTEQYCEDQECVLENIHINTCKELIKSNLLQPTSVIGIIGIMSVTVMVAVGVIAALSFCLCIAARSYHVRMWRPQSEDEYSRSEGVNSLELEQQLRSQGFLD